MSSNDIKVGTNVEVDGSPWRVLGISLLTFVFLISIVFKVFVKLGFALFFLEFLHVKPGKGAAFVRTKLKNYLSGNTVEKTFRAGSSVMHPSFCKTFLISLCCIG